MHLKVFIFSLCAIAANAGVKSNRGIDLESCLNEFLDENGKLSLQGFEGTGRCLLGYKDVSKCKFDALNVSYTIFAREGVIENPLDYLPECPDSSREVKIIVHGWQSHPSNAWVVDMKNAYLKKGNYYVMTVDWSEAAKKCQYFSSAANTQCVGYKLGHFILSYFRECNIPFENVHIIGHSLGAHVAGFAGKYVLEFANKQIGRVTALDPAAYCFDTEKKDRLSEDDAIIVDVYHTDNGIGLTAAIGDYDFFVNNGIAPQPGCVEDKHDFKDIIKGVFYCSHARSHEYFIESIFDEFIATKCKKIPLLGFVVDGPNARMGENLQAKETGSYCIQTNDKSPFSKTA